MYARGMAKPLDVVTGNKCEASSTGCVLHLVNKRRSCVTRRIQPLNQKSGDLFGDNAHKLISVSCGICYIASEQHTDPSLPSKLIYVRGQDYYCFSQSLLSVYRQIATIMCLVVEACCPNKCHTLITRLELCCRGSQSYIQTHWHDPSNHRLK